MVSKWAQDEKRRRKAECAAEMSEMDREALELMRHLRRYVGGYEYREGERAEVSRALHAAIEKWAEVVTGDDKYFHEVRSG